MNLGSSQASEYCFDDAVGKQLPTSSSLEYFGDILDYLWLAGSLQDGRAQKNTNLQVADGNWRRVLSKLIWGPE